MSTTDSVIASLGFIEESRDLSENSITYINKDHNHRVTIQWGENDSECIIYSEDSYPEYNDFVGKIYISNGINLLEVKAFMSKIYEMKEGY